METDRAPSKDSHGRADVCDEISLHTKYRRGDIVAGKYRLDSVVGEGGMGLVLRATHVGLGRPVALKVLRRELLQNTEIIERMLAEARTAANIRSEHAARVLDVGTLDGGAPYIVFEYLEGRDLAALLDEHGPLPIPIAVDFILQVCDALAEAHAANVIHRDLKPENLFLTRRPDGTPVIKVLDFGISKNLSRRDPRAAHTNPAKLIGSPYYMAPEQMLGSASADTRSDIWALGVVLYELCTSQTPFSGDSVPAVCHLVLNEKPTPPRTFLPEMPPALESLILKCLEKKPKNRFADVSEFASALVSFGTEEAKAYAERVCRVLAGATSPGLSPTPVTLSRAPMTAVPGVRVVIGEAPPEWDVRNNLPSLDAFRTPAGVSALDSLMPYVRVGSRGRVLWKGAGAAFVAALLFAGGAVAVPWWKSAQPKASMEPRRAPFVAPLPATRLSEAPRDAALGEGRERPDQPPIINENDLPFESSAGGIPASARFKTMKAATRWPAARALVRGDAGIANDGKALILSTASSNPAATGFVDVPENIAPPPARAASTRVGEGTSFDPEPTPEDVSASDARDRNAFGGRR